MLFSDDLLEEKNTLIFEASIMHEIQHLLHNDNIELVGIRDILDKKDKECRSEENPNARYFFNKKLTRFAEKRADILACCTALNIRQH